MFLGHLSRRLSIGRHPSSSTFQMTSPLKPWSRFLPYFTYNIYRWVEQIRLFFCPSWMRTLFAMATYSCNWLMIWINENWHLLLSYCRYFDKSFTKMFLEWSSTKHIFFCCCYLLICLVPMATKRQNLWKQSKKNQLFRSCLGDKAETLQNCF